MSETPHYARHFREAGLASDRICGLYHRRVDQLDVVSVRSSGEEQSIKRVNQAVYLCRYFCAETKGISAKSQPAPEESEFLKHFDHRPRGGSRARRVLTGDEAAIDNVKVIPDARSALV